MTVIVPTVLAVLLGLALLAICWLLYLDRSMRQAVREVINGVNAPKHGKPCRHPGCMIARSKLNVIVGPRRFHRLLRHSDLQP